MILIPYGRHWIDDEDIEAVVKTLRSDYLTQGPKVKEFENALCNYTGATYAVSVSNGTAALHLACLAAGIKPNCEVITSPISFVASANCIVYCGGRPVFADILEDTYNINPDEIRKAIGDKTKALLPVHFSGDPCDMDKIFKIARDNNLVVIEDASHAFGSRYNGERIGSCRFSDMTIFSFHPVKALTTGEGGAILTNRKDLYERLLLLRSHGITKDPDIFFEQACRTAPWYYEMQDLGFNYRLSDIQAALGLSQLNRIDSFIKRRRDIVHKYNEAFARFEEFTIPIEKNGLYSACHLYVLLIDFNTIGKARERVMKELEDKNIKTQVHYIPIHTQPYYQTKFGYSWGDFPKAEAFYERALSLPLYPKMSDEDVHRVIKAILEIATVKQV
jgi:UDP-4-amino-4,6-dideoxy-N-acetyl-beta-L-altrosamine transaminase